MKTLRHVCIGLCSIALISAANAQQVEQQIYTLTLSSSEINLIGQGLSELPFKTSNQLIAKLSKQLHDQDDQRGKQVEKDKQ